MTIDLGAIAETCMAMAAVGLGGVVWRTAVLVSKVETRLTDHENRDAEIQGLALAEIRELREAMTR